MLKETKYIDIHYTDKDINYIDDLTEFINNNSKDIVDFFGLENFKEKVILYMFDDLEKFRKNISNKYKNNIVPSWLCGFSYNENNNFIIKTLCLDEYKKTKGHTNHNLNDLKNLILHEFVHSCQLKYINFLLSNIKLPLWLKEGMACLLSRQYDDVKLGFDATLDEVINGNTNYSNYYTMFLYVYNTYGKEYILELLRNSEKLISETPVLHEETIKYYNNIKNNIRK